MEIERYLARIDYSGPLDPSPATLAALHRAHLLAIPFENVDEMLERKASAEEEAIYEKMVVRRRGGECEEMSRLFTWALGELGFEVQRITAFAGEKDDRLSHYPILVRLDPLFLAEVGFGTGFLEPLPLIPGQYLQQGFRRFRLERADEEWRFYNDSAADDLYHGFQFKQTPVSNEVTARALQQPLGVFLATRFTPEGLLLMRNAEYRHWTEAGDARLRAESLDDFRQVLRQHFHLGLEDLSSKEIASLWRAVRFRQAMVNNAFGS